MDISRKAARGLAVGCVLIAPALFLTACASGGGGGGSGDSGALIASPPPPSPPPSPPPPPAAALPTIPSPSSFEFENGAYLGPDNAAVAFNLGATGKGIVIADVDTGADPSRPDLAGAISSQSTDIVAGRNQPVGTDAHADWVASVLGARYNGQGTIGVAFQSTILSIRADTGSPAGFTDANLAAGIEYAVAHHVQVINLSLGSMATNSAGVQQALLDAANAGIAVTTSAGNFSAAGAPVTGPDYPAAYATDPRFGGLIVAVGATTTPGVLASFSNQAGTAANNYLTAPGVNLVADCASTCELVTGTSFAAPQVAGAIALLLQTFPNLTAAQAVQIILNSTDDEGAAGTDPVFGRGSLDIGKAFSPMGTMSLPMSDGSMRVLNAAPGAGTGLQTSTLSGAMGDSLSRTEGLTTIGYDSYHRLFKIDLGAGFASAQVRGLVAATPAMHETTAQVSSPTGGTAAFASGGALAAAPDQPSDRLFAGDAEPGYTQVAAGVGRLSLAAWRGQGGVQPDLGQPRDAFQSIAAADQVEAASLNLGRVSLSAEGGTSQRLAPYASAPQPGSSYARVAADFRGNGFAGRIAVGALSEPNGPLGSVASGPYALPAQTRFLTFGGERIVGDGAALYAEMSLGRTTFQGPLLRLHDSLASSWRMGFTGPCAKLLGCADAGLELAQPLRFERGLMTADLAAVPDAYFAPLVFTQRRIGIAPSGREVDLRLFVDEAMGRFGRLRLEGVAASNEGNIANAPVGLGLLAGWRASF